MYVSEDKYTLEKLNIFDKFNLRNFLNSDTLILKSFYNLDVPINIVKKLYEEPERMKLWDTNV